MAGSNGTAAAAAVPTYDWEVAFREDPRAHALQAAIDRILLTSFPVIAAKHQKLQPPATRQESALPSVVVDAPVVKPEPIQPAWEELDVAAYMTESSSDVDSQAEIDPKEALREMEARAARGESPVPSGNKSGGVAMADPDDAFEPVGSADEEDEEDEQPTACAACHRADNEKQILLCDGCEDEYHMYCLRPPLTDVPPGDWFCPTCAAARTNHPSGTEPEAMDVDDEPLSESIVRIKQEKARGLGRETPEPEKSPSAATSVGIAQTFENDVGKSNELLIHACHCDVQRCMDPMFREFCSHMKRFLRSACWASHNEKWLSYRIAKATAELLAYHSLHCRAERCHVPLCAELRAEEYV